MHRQAGSARHRAGLDVIRFGRAVRALRHRQRLRQVDVAERAEVSDSLISLIEHGRIAAIPFGTLHKLARALGADLELIVRWRGEALDRLLDEAHAEIVDAVVSRLQSAG